MDGRRLFEVYAQWMGLTKRIARARRIAFTKRIAHTKRFALTKRIAFTKLNARTKRTAFTKRIPLTKRIALAMLLALAAHGCAEPVPEIASGPVVTDSAGVRRVANREPRWGTAEGWRVSAEPVLRIGLVDGAREYLFHRIADLTRLSDGTIVVLNAGDGQLRYYSADGEHLRSVGGEGDGPGEMRDGRWLDRLENDVVQVTHRGGRLRYAPDGTLLADDRLRWDRMHALGRAADISNSSGFLMESCWGDTPLFLGDVVLLCASTYTDVRFLPSEAGYHESEMFVARSGWSLEVLDTIGTFAYRGMVRYPAAGRLFSARIGPPYAPRGSMRVSGSPPQLAYTEARAYCIELHSITGPERRLVIERAGGLRAPTSDELAGFDRSFDGEQPFDGIGIRPVGPSRSRPLRPAGDADEFRDQVAVVDSVSIIEGAPHVDALGAVWAPLESPPDAPSRVYDVFDAAGIYLGQVELPRLYFRIEEIGDDYILGIYSDELGVEYVTMYRLTRS